MSKIQELEKELALAKQKVYNALVKEVKTLYGFTVGDCVEYTYSDFINDYDTQTFWDKGEVYKVEKRGESYFIHLKGKHNNYNADCAKLFDENDYTMRHSVWERELDLGDTFQLTVDKPKSTKGKIYNVFKVVKQVGENIEYWYLNDFDKPQTLYEGEFHVTRSWCTM